MKIIILYLIVAAALGSCAFHTGNVSCGGQIDCPVVNLATGTAKTEHIFGFGGLNKNALILEAKKYLLSKYPYRKGVFISNYTVDYKNTFFPFYHSTKVFISAEVFDCNYKVDSVLFADKNPTVNGFRVGDSILFDFNGKIKSFKKGVVSNQMGSVKIKIEYINKKHTRLNKKVYYDCVFKTTKSIENVNYFGFEVGEIAYIRILNKVTNTKSVKTCKIIGLNFKKCLIEYVSDDNSTKLIVAERDLIKKQPN